VERTSAERPAAELTEFLAGVVEMFSLCLPNTG